MEKPESALPTLLRTLAPALRDGEWTFCTLPRADAAPLLAEALATFQEDEGTSLVLPLARARALGLATSGVWRCITLAVHSSLDAVGMIAAVATALAERGIAVNPIAAHHHDHLLVPAPRADEAMDALRALAAAPPAA